MTGVRALPERVGTLVTIVIIAGVLLVAHPMRAHAVTDTNEVDCQYLYNVSRAYFGRIRTLEYEAVILGARVDGERHLSHAHVICCFPDGDRFKCVRTFDDGLEKTLASAGNRLMELQSIANREHSLGRIALQSRHTVPHINDIFEKLYAQLFFVWDCIEKRRAAVEDKRFSIEITECIEGITFTKSLTLTDSDGKQTRSQRHSVTVNAKTGFPLKCKLDQRIGEVRTVSEESFSEYAESSGILFPMKMVITVGDWSETTTLSKIEFNKQYDDSVFEIDFPPGTVVDDERSGTSFVVGSKPLIQEIPDPEPGSPFDETEASLAARGELSVPVRVPISEDELATAYDRQESMVTPRRGPTMRYVVIVGVGVGFLGLAWYVFRRKPRA